MNSVISEGILLSRSASLALCGMKGPYLTKPPHTKGMCKDLDSIACSSGAVTARHEQDTSMTDMLRLDSTS
jgi:predicted small lipoprotein YifL